MKKIFILLSTVFLLNQVYAQTDTRGTTVINTSETETTINGNTYALIIGINYANRKKFSQLHYAVNDANLLNHFFNPEYSSILFPMTILKLYSIKMQLPPSFGMDLIG